MIKCKKCNKEFKKDVDNEMKLLTAYDLTELSYELFNMGNLEDYENIHKCPNCGEINKETE